MKKGYVLKKKIHAINLSVWLVLLQAPNEGNSYFSNNSRSPLCFGEKCEIKHTGATEAQGRHPQFTRLNTFLAGQDHGPSRTQEFKRFLMPPVASFKLFEVV